jgi:hypothetical protein
VPEKDEMYKQVEWMKPADQEILQVLSSGLWLSTGNISKNTGYTSSWVRDRCAEMADRRVLDSDSSAETFYRINSLGEDILNRQLTPREITRRTALASDYELVDED